MSGRDNFPPGLDPDDCNALADEVFDEVEQAIHRHGGSGHSGQVTALAILCAALAKAAYAYGSPSADADVVHLMSETVASMLAEMRGAEEPAPDPSATHPGSRA